MPIRAALFDFDGTLADSFEAITASTNYVRTSYGLPPLPESVVREYVGFGLPNLMEGKLQRTAILKTYASTRPGVGHLLADTFHRAARDFGFTDVIHALMHVDNDSLKRSKRHAGKVFRRYAQMARRLP